MNFDFIQTNWIENLGWLIVHSLWQISLLAFFYFTCIRFLKLANSRYVLGLVLLVAAALSPIITAVGLPGSGFEDPVTQLALNVGDNNAESSSDIRDESRSEDTVLVDRARDEHSIKTDLSYSRSQRNDAASPLTNAAENSLLHETAADNSSDNLISNWMASTLKLLVVNVRPWLPSIVFAWSIGVLLLSLRPIAGFHLHWVLRREESEAPKRIIDRTAALSRSMGIRKTIRVFASDRFMVPFVIGHFRPMILLPLSTLTNLSSAEIDAILRHELAHIRRYDSLINFAQVLLETLFFFHPALWWLSRQVRLERENCCDDLACHGPDSAKTLAKALYRLEKARPPASGVLAANGGDLKQRIARLLSSQQRQSRPISIGNLAFFFMVAIALLISFSAAASAWHNSEPTSELNLTMAEKNQDDFDKVVVESIGSKFKWKKFQSFEAQDIEEILKKFPEANQGRTGMTPAGYIADCQFIFTGPNEIRLVIFVNFDLALWSEGDGDFRLKNPKAVIEFLNQMESKNTVEKSDKLSSEKEIASERKKNLAVYKAQKKKLHAEFAGKWVTIAGGEMKGPFESLEKADESVKENFPNAGHRFIFRPTIDDADVQFLLSPFGSDNPGWRQFGMQFAKHHRLVDYASENIVRSNGKSVGTDNGRMPVSIESSRGKKKAGLRIGCSRLFDAQLTLTEREARELDLDLFSVPGDAVYAGDKTNPGRKAFCRVRIPELEIDEVVLAYVLSEKTTDSTKGVTDLQRMENSKGPIFVPGRLVPMKGNAIDDINSKRNEIDDNPDEAIDVEKVKQDAQNRIKITGSYTQVSNPKSKRPYFAGDYMYIADRLQNLVEEDRAKLLSSWAKEYNDQVIVLCRMLFCERAGNKFRRPGLGGPVFFDRDKKNWPLEPIAICKGVPLVVVRGYVLGGRAESATRYLAYCQKNCDWVTEGYAEQDDKAMEAGLKQFLADNKITDKEDVEFFEAQIKNPR